MVAAAVGLQAVGWRPFASTFAAFLSRAYDFVRMAAISRATFSLCGSHAGVSIGEDGPSQMALEDIASLRAIHGSTVLHPCDANQTAKLVAAMAETDGISYLRTLRPATPVLYAPDEEFEIGGSRVLRSSENDEVALIGAGITVHEALKAADALAEDGIAARVIDLYSIKPLDAETLRAAAEATGGRLVTDRGPLGRGRPRRRRARRARRLDEPPRVVKLAVREMPRSGKPEELPRRRRHRRRAHRSAAARARCADRARGLILSRLPLPFAAMAVLIASELRKEFAGDPLFENVSFTVGRKDRLSLAGANGAGKTTLLRAIAGETSIQGGKLAFAKGTRDRASRPAPAARVRHHAPRVRALRRTRPARGRGRAATPRAGDGRRRARRRDAAALCRGAGAARARGRMGLARSCRCCRARPRLRRRRPRSAARHVLRRRADARIARPRARRQPRSPPARRADEPPRRPEPRVARTRARDHRRCGHPRRARPLVPRGGHDVGARAVSGRRALLLRAVARMAPGEGDARGGSRQDRRPRGRRHRPARALRRAVPLQEIEGEAGAGEADADRTPREGAHVGQARGRIADEEAPLARLRLPRPAAQRAHRARSRRHRALRR